MEAEFFHIKEMYALQTPTSQLTPIATHGKRHRRGNEYIRNQYFYR